MIIEQTELRSSAKQLLASVDARDPAALWSALCAAGWPALTAPEQFGGLAQPFQAATWLYAELGAALSPAPLPPALLAIDALLACGESAARDALLDQLAAGAPVAASLLDPLDIQRQNASRDVSCELSAVAGAGAASHLLLASPTTIALIPIDAKGVSVAQCKLWDETRPLANVRLEDVRLHDEWVLACGAGAYAPAAACSTHLHYAIAADCIGAADALLRQTIEFLNTRRQFDRPLAMFQALKHRCADLKTSNAAADALLGSRVQAMQPCPEGVALARGTKALASAVYREVAEEAMQLHGGISMTVEHSCHRFLKRALLNEHLASANDACDLASAEHLFRTVRA